MTHSAMDVCILPFSPPLILFDRSSRWAEFPTVLQYGYWDNRPFDRGGQTTRNFENLQGNYRENKLGLVAYLEPSIGARTESIVFCPNALDRFSGESLKSVREKAYSRGERNLDNIRDNVLAMNLLHELSHSRLVLRKDEAGKDNFYGVLFLLFLRGVNEC